MAAATPALALENPSPRYYTAEDTSDEYGGPGLSWSGPAKYGPGRSGDRDDEAFAIGGAGRLVADDADEGNFGTRAFTLRFSALFSGDAADEQVLSKRASCRSGTFLDVRTRDGRISAELQGQGHQASVLHPADVHDGAWHVITVSRTGPELAVTVDGDRATSRSAGVVDLDTSAPIRLGDGPCVGSETTPAEVLVDDLSYGPGPLPTERPLVPVLQVDPPRAGSILAGPGEILAPNESDDADRAPSEDAASEDTGGSEEGRAESEHPSGRGDDASGAPLAAPAGGSAGGPPAGPGAGGGGPAPVAQPPAPRTGPAAAAFPADSGAAAGIAAAVLPGAGDAAARSAYPGLDWTGVLTPPAPPARPGPPGQAAAPGAPALPAPAPPAAGLPAPEAPAPLSRAATTYDRGVAATAFADGLRSPREVRWDVGAIAQSLLLTLVLLALLALPVGIVNSTAAANARQIGIALARLRAHALARWTERLPFAGAVASIAGVASVLYGFLEPSFWFDESSLALVLGLALAFLVVTVVQQISRSAYMDQWWGIRGELTPFPAFVLIAIGCVVLSRLFGLEPGLVLGTLAAFATARALRSDEEGPAVALSALSLTVVGLVAWLARDVVVAAAGPASTFLPELLGAAFTAVAVAAVGNLAFTLVPLAFLDGAALFRWSKPVWTTFATLGAFAFVHVLLRPAADGVLGGRGAFLAVALGGYLLAAAGFWAWFRYHPEPTLTAGRERQLVG